MSLQKLSKQIQRELKANPQKVGGVGVWMLVAVWFWLPLIFKKDESSSSSSASSSTASQPTPAKATPATTAATTEPGKVEEPRPRWQDLVAWIENDPDMKSFTFETLPDEVRDPFLVAVTPEQKQQQEEAAQVAVEEPVKMPPQPGELGLRVSSTIIGKQRRTALINGRAYREGDAIEMDEGWVYVLSAIEKNHVVLACDGHEYQLAIARGERSGRIDLRGRN